MMHQPVDEEDMDFLPPPVAEEECDTGAPSVCTDNRYPTDRLLRDFGFSIWSRWRKREAIWKRGDQYFTQRRALAVIEAEKALLKAIFESE